MGKDQGASAAQTGLSSVGSSPQAVSPADAASIPSAVWLIWATEGEYSDRTEWPIAVCLDRATGEAITARLGQLWRELHAIYKRREDDLEKAGDWSGETLFKSTPEGLEYFALTGATGWLSGCYSDDRAFTCSEVPVLLAQAIEARSGETGTGSIGAADESVVAKPCAQGPEA